jgi:nitrate reductase delta subunit
MIDREILPLLARVIEYPVDGPRAAHEAVVALARAHPAAATALAELETRFEVDGAGAMEEAYTAAFELAPVCSPFVGDQLFGATAARHAFLARVGALQREAGFDPAPELADHLAVVLRFLAVAPDGEAEVLAQDGALPAAHKMKAALAAAQHPWAGALAAIVDVLEGAGREPDARAPASAQEALS